MTSSIDKMTPSKRQKIDPVVSEEDCQTFVNELELLNKTENFSEVKSFIILGNSHYPKGLLTNKVSTFSEFRFNVEARFPSSNFI